MAKGEKSWSKYQQAIFHEYEHTKNNLLINAIPGSGKSTVIVEMARRTEDYNAMIAFNKAIVQELVKKVGHKTKVMTIHSMGMASVVRRWGKIDVKEKKTNEFVAKHCAEGGIWSDIKPKEKAQLFAVIPNLIDAYRANLCSGRKDLIESADKMGVMYDIDHIDKALIVWKDLVEYNKAPSKIDFMDMIYLPATDIEYSLPKFKVWFLDECQDFSKCQQELLRRAIGRSRAVFVGDENQCQPAGTKVLLSDGNEVNIEDIEVGQSVVGYNANEKGGFTGYYEKDWVFKRYEKHAPKVLEKSSRIFRGNMHTVTDDSGNISRYTPNHKCMAKVKDGDFYATYMMCKGDRFRVGIIPLYSKSTRMFSLKPRSRAENADCSWILDVFNTRDEAYVFEQIISFKYGIPQTRFIDNVNTGSVDSQGRLNDIWNGMNVDLSERAMKLLSDLNMDIRYPIYIKGNSNNHISRNGVFEVHASNLNPKYMQVLSFSESDRFQTKKGSWKGVFRDFNMSVKYVKEKVYSLSISKGEKYVADGILTHNCIYGFAGADTKSFDKLRKWRGGIKEMPLSICYRCPKKVIMHANQVYDTMESPEWMPDGVVKLGDYRDACGEDVVICRNLKPLVEVYFDLIAMKKKCFIKGKDIGKGMMSLISPYVGQTKEDMLIGLFQKLHKLEDQLIGQGMSHPKKHPRYVNLDEQIAVIERIAKNYANPTEMIRTLEAMFEDDGKGITLTSIHRAKGMEADNVFLLDKHLIPSKYAETDEQITQEMNLLYVALSRSMKSLIYCYSK